MPSQHAVREQLLLENIQKNKYQYSIGSQVENFRGILL
jgi:hypothetical protein